MSGVTLLLIHLSCSVYAEINKTTSESRLQLCVQSWKRRYVWSTIFNTNSPPCDGPALFKWNSSILQRCRAVDHPLDQYAGQRTSLNLQHATVLYKSMHVTILIKLRKRRQSTQFANKQKDTCSRWWRQTDLRTLASLTSSLSGQWDLDPADEAPCLRSHMNKSM